MQKTMIYSESYLLYKANKQFSRLIMKLQILQTLLIIQQSSRQNLHILISFLYCRLLALLYNFNFITNYHIFSMEQFLHCLCCCFETNSPPPPRSRSKTRRSAKEYRLNTKYKKQDLIKIPDQQRKNGKLKAYCCPICVNYYNRILACGECNNCLCLNCFQSYDEKKMEKRAKMKCPFCNSIKSVFTDYELQPHSYFDTTNKGFLSKEERLKIDNEIKPAISVQLPTVHERTELVLQINSQH